ncbi:MAG: DUF6326 family protein [Vicinamibacterales bacterium]
MPSELTTPLDEAPVPVRVKLSFLWTSVMLCYVYGDYFELYVPGKLESMLGGRIGPLGAVTQEKLLGTAILMAIPSLMVVSSASLPARAARLLNIIAGLLYSAIMVLAIQGSWAFYRFFGVLEIALTLLAVWWAWRWPRNLA